MTFRKKILFLFIIMVMNNEKITPVNQPDTQFRKISARWQKKGKRNEKSFL